MARTRTPIRLLLMGLMVAVLSCTDATTPIEPPSTPEPEAGLLGGIGDLLRGTVDRTGLLKCHPMQTYTASQWVGPRGGTIRVGPHTLEIPRNALTGWTHITATAPSGRVNLVEFEPHGLEFRRSAELTMSYANCSLIGRLLPGHIAYVDGDLDILKLLSGLANPWRQTVSADLDHFSGYAVAW